LKALLWWGRILGADTRESAKCEHRRCEEAQCFAHAPESDEGRCGSIGGQPYQFLAWFCLQKPSIAPAGANPFL